MSEPGARTRPAWPDRIDRIRPVHRVAGVAALTLLPFAWKAVTYALVGSFVPLTVFAVMVTAIALGVTAGGRWERRSLRLWAAAMVVWSVLRLTLLATRLVTDAAWMDAHLRYQLTPLFALVSVVYLAAGAWMWRTHATPG